MASKSATKDGGNYIVSQFYGLNTANNNPKNLRPGEAQDYLNWITGWNPELKAADNIQLRTGTALLTQTRLGAGKVNALAVGQDTTGKQWVFFAAGGQYYYFNTATNDLATVGNGTLAATEDMTLEFYQDLFGPYMYSGSQNTGINAISVANKQLKNMNGSNVSGYLTIRQNFGWMWNWLNSLTKIVDTNDLNQSNPDQVSTASSSISNPQGSTGVQGNGVLKTFSGTLAGFSNLGFTAQVGAPINSLAVTSFSIPAAAPFSSSYDISVVYAGGYTFNTGDFVVLQGDTTVDTALNDCMGIVQTVNGTTSIAFNFINKPTLSNTTSGIATVTVAAGGSGYTLNDILTLTGGSNGTVQVTGVSGGAITSVSLLTPGVGYTASTNYTVTGGTGSSAQIQVQTVSSSVSDPNMKLSKLEMFEDNGNGVLTSILNSNDVGTVNYVTGAFTINTQTAVPSGLNIDSICFTGVPGVITFAPGFWQQFGGQLKAVKFFNNQLYQFHNINTWLILLGFASSTSTTGTNGQQQYRQNLGVPYFRAAYEKGEGILFLDDTEQNNPHLRILQISDFSTATEPADLSETLNLSQNNFSQCVVNSIGNYDFLACQSIHNGVAIGYNDTTYLRNNLSGYWDKTDLRIAVMDSYNGQIIAGDTISQNVMQLFTGVDDDGSPINNKWTSGLMNLGMSGLKRFYYFLIDIYIGISQSLNIYLQLDTGAFVLIATVNGTDSDVDRNDSITIGQGLMGNNPIGGQGNGQIYGYRCRRQINYCTDLFEYVAVKFQATKIGALQINQYGFMSIRQKPLRVQTI